MYAGINIMNSSRKQKEMIEVKCPAVGLVYCFLTVCIDQSGTFKEKNGI